MNNKPIKNPFWHIFGPLVMYWIVSFVVEIIVSSAIVIVNVYDFAAILNGVDPNNTKAFTEAIQQCALIAVKLGMKYAVEIQSIKALGVILVMTLFFRRDRKREKELQIPVNLKASLPKYILLLGLGIVYNIGVTCLTQMIQMVVGDSGYQNTSITLYSTPILIEIIGLGILVPLMEELLFRGVMYKRMKERTTFFRAAFSSAILFAFFHNSMIMTINALAFGLLLAYVYEKYGSFKAPVCLHIVSNITAVLGTETKIYGWLAASPERLSIAVVVCAFLGAVLFVLIQKIKEKPDEPTEILQKY